MCVCVCVCVCLAQYVCVNVSDQLHAATALLAGKELSVVIQ